MSPLVAGALIACFNVIHGPAARPPEPIDLWDPALAGFEIRLKPDPTSEMEAREAPIQDNSFLVEEAYNQEPGVIQHISSFSRSRATGDWVYAFTEEWPVPRQAHQLSVTVPYERIHASSDGRSAVGDVALNYRYQLAGNGEARLALAPRFSMLLPVGDVKQSRGAGGVGYQVNVPISVVVNRAFVTHLNAGVTLTPASRNAAGDEAATTAWNVGQSIIWLAKPTFNALLEVIYTSGQTVTAPGQTTRVNSLLLNPGVRWAINCSNGLQIVPAIGVPIGVGPSRGGRQVFAYLSFEHPLWRAR